MDRNKIVKFCEDYLNVKNFNDYCINGLQVEGAEKIEKIITGVSWSKKLIEAAIIKNAQMIMVHHGLFSEYVFLSSNNKLPQIKGVTRERLKLLLSNNINLCGFHLPLDAHPLIGNNISLLKLLELKKIGELNVPEYGTIGFLGEFGKPVLFSQFVKEVNSKLMTKSYIIAAGNKKVKKIAIISGGAAPDFKYAIEQGADVYLCGEIREATVRAVEEAKINFINAGHYNTEKLGIKNLGELVAKKLKVKAEFIDIPNEV